MAPALRRVSTRWQRAGESVLSSAGKSSSVRTCKGCIGRPSATRFQAASKRSRASPGAPTRISRTLGIAHVALEVVAQLLHRAELVGPAAATHAPAMVAVLDQLAVAQHVAEIVVQLDLQQMIADEGFLVQDDHIWPEAP